MLVVLSSPHMRLTLFVFFGAISSSTAITPPSGVDVARLSNVAWNDPTWANDGTGAMPIGNGDATSSVWVDSTSGAKLPIFIYIFLMQLVYHNPI